MALFHARSLWPARDRTPFVRLGFALLAGPGVVASLFSLFAFLIAGMTETSGAAVLSVTARTAASLSALVFLFTLAFGLPGIAVLWWRAKRGVMSWALTGAVAGALAGALFGALAMSGVRQALVIAFALGGWSIFLLIRRFAGVRDAPARPSSA